MTKKLNVELKKEYKGGVKQFPGVVSLLDYINTNYGEITDLLDTDDINEIVNCELQDKQFVVYKDPETPVAAEIEYDDVYSCSVKDFGEKFYCYVNGYRNLISGGWATIENRKKNLKDLYFVDDESAIEKLKEEYRQELAQKEIESLKEKEEKRQKIYVEETRLREKYGLKPCESVAFASAFEALNNSIDEAEKYGLFIKAVKAAQHAPMAKQAA